jgi:nitroreductase
MKRFILNLLSKETIASIKSAKVRFDEVIIRYFGLSGFTASVYYAFISRQFDREHKAVLAGRVQYKHSLEKGGISSVLLRRNIHRLEKGLIMQPRRSIFGEGFITETVSNYHDCYVKNILCEDEFKWASDVLSEYFTIVGDSKITLQARAIYEQVPIKDKGSKKSIPYVHEALPQSTISYEQLYTLYQRRRSVRWYMDKPVEAEKLKKVIEAASLAPSACNRQPYRFYVANDSQKATEIAKCAMGTVGFAENLPCIIAVIGDLSAYPFERDRHIIYIDAALASMQLMLACETLGLSTCPINWPDIEIRERMLEKRLGLQVHERTIMLIAVGYGASDGGIAFSQKKGSNILMQDIHNEH